MALAPSVCHVGFFTLTTPDNCSDHHEFRQRWRSFNSHYFSQSPHFGHWLATYERQRRGAWHLHVLVLLPYDIRTGVDFTQFALGRYSSAPPYLRAVWRELRIKCKAYGFSRHELLPIKSNADAMAQYIGKYISKHLGSRKDEDKGKRLIASSSGWTKNSIRFSWFNDNSILWRTNLAILARELGFKDFLIFLPGSVQAGPTTLPPLSKMWVPTNGIKSSMVKLLIVLQVKSFSRHREAWCKVCFCDALHDAASAARTTQLNFNTEFSP